MDTNAQTTDQPTPQELRDARYAALDSKAVTDAARKLVDTLCDQIATTELRLGKRQHKRMKKAAQLRMAVEGFMADLLRAQASGNGFVYRSLRPASFTGEPVSHKTFTAMVQMLTDMGLLGKHPGFQATVQFDVGGPKVPYLRHATRFRATQTLLDICGEHGVRAADVNQHFLLPLPEFPLQLRASSSRNEYGNKVRGRLMPFERTGRIAMWENDLRRFNEFMDQFELRGGLHRGYIRVFNNGDTPDFQWDKGGRLYSQGGEVSYQQMPKTDRLQMTINGEPVCEIDIRASYLTIFHAWNGVYLDPRSDPYDLPGLGPEARPVVKAWFVATFGNDAHLDKWPKEIAAEYRERTGRSLSKDYPITRIREKAIEVHPVLARWSEPIDVRRMYCDQSHHAIERWRDGNRRMGWADLMYLESAAMLYAIYVLYNQKVPSLSVHDSLIVPASKQDLAVNALRKGFTLVAATDPITLVVHHPRPEGDDNESTVFYGDEEDTGIHEGEFGDFGDLEEENEFNPVSSDEDRGGDWTDDDQGSVGNVRHTTHTTLTILGTFDDVVRKRFQSETGVMICMVALAKTPGSAGLDRF
jgi:hypothetical protein